MKKDTHKTKVKFLIHKHDKSDVFAYFPDIKFTDEVNMYSSYAHTGQHSACHLYYTFECNNATPEQYNDLKNELEGIGYNLEILN